MKTLDDSLKTIREGVEKDSELKQFWFNARHAGKAGTQLESWTQDVWVEAMKRHIRRLLKEQRAEMVIELENIKLPKYEGSAKSAMRLGIQAERDFYNKEINKLITKLEQGEEK